MSKYAPSMPPSGKSGRKPETGFDYNQLEIYMKNGDPFANVAKRAHIQISEMEDCGTIRSYSSYISNSTITISLGVDPDFENMCMSYNEHFYNLKSDIEQELPTQKIGKIVTINDAEEVYRITKKFTDDMYKSVEKLMKLENFFVKMIIERHISFLNLIDILEIIEIEKDISDISDGISMGAGGGAGGGAGAGWTIMPKRSRFDIRPSKE
jgi:hypothetical protein